MEEFLENDKCQCGSQSEGLHVCPYKEDVNGDTESLCSCCSQCQDQCSMDI